MTCIAFDQLNFFFSKVLVAKEDLAMFSSTCQICKVQIKKKSLAYLFFEQSNLKFYCVFKKSSTLIISKEKVRP